MIRKTVLILCLFLNACSLVKEGRPQQLQFVPAYSQLTEQRDRAPFEGFLMDDRIMFNEYNSYKLYIRPVDYQEYKNYLIYQKKEEFEKVEDLTDEAVELGRYFRNKLRLALLGFRSSNAKKKPFVLLVDDPLEADYQLALTFVRIKPANPTVNLLGTLLGFFVPGGGVIKLTVSSYISIAGYLQSNEDQMKYPFQFYDSEGQKFYPFTFKDFHRYAHARVAIDDWAMQLVDLMHSSSQHKVEEGSLIGIDLF